MKEAKTRKSIRRSVLSLAIFTNVFVAASFYAKANAAWQIETVDAISHVDGHTSLALDSFDRPHIGYTDRTTAALKHAYYNGTSWSIDTVDSAIGNWPEALASLVLDSLDRPHLAYYCYWPDYQTKYAYFDGSSWHIVPIDSSLYKGYYVCPSALALDSSDMPHVAYTGYEDFFLKYAHYDGTAWQRETVDDSGELGLGISMAIDSADNPHIAYTTPYPYKLKYAYHDGTSWTVQTVCNFGSMGRYCSIAIDSSGNPHISCQGNSRLKHIYSNGTTWVVETPPGSTGDGRMSSIALDSLDRPHISHSYDPDEDLMYTYYDGINWITEVVDTEGDTGQSTSLALDSFGRPHISYEDDTNHIVKYATKVYDNLPPVANAGPDQVVEGTSPAGAEVTLDGSGSSDDGQIQPLTYEWEWAGSSTTDVKPKITLPLGTTTVTLTVYDGQFESSDNVEITVQDTMPPIITCPEDITVEAQSGDGIPATDPAIQVFLASVSATDLCDPSPVISHDAPTQFPVGVTMVTLTATDNSGNTSNCQATVTVTYEAPQDTTPPVIESIIADPGVLWPPNHKLVEVVVCVDAWDNSGETPVCSIAEITSNESINGPGDGNSEPDWYWQATDDPLVLVIWLRAESAGIGTGRIYYIEVTCSDPSGNESNGTVEVIVPHDQGKGKD